MLSHPGLAPVARPPLFHQQIALRASELHRVEQGLNHDQRNRRGARAANRHRAAPYWSSFGFIHEDNMSGCQIGLSHTPLFARLGDIGVVLFCGVR